MGKISKLLAVFLFAGLWFTNNGYSQDRFIISGSLDNTVQKIDDTGNIVWTYTGHTGGILDVTADSDGNVYTASADGTARKLDVNGNFVWSYTEHTGVVSSVAVDLDGNVYTGGDDTSLHKIDSTGTQVWVFNGHTGEVLSVAVDGSGNVYSGSDDTTIRKIDSAGTQLWSYTLHTDWVRSVKVDLDGNVYSASDDQTVHKIDQDGNQVWVYNSHTNWVMGVDVDYEGNVYTASLDNTAHKVDANGNQVWVYSAHTNWVNDVKADRRGNVYTASEDNTVHKIDSAGNQVWTYTGHSNAVYAVAVEGDILNPVTLLSPSNEITNVGLNPTLTWEAIAGADTYELVLSTDQTFTNTIISEINLTQASYDVVNALTEGTVYYWRVRGVEQNGTEGEWSDVWQFTTETSTTERYVIAGSRSTEVRKLDGNGNTLWTFDAFLEPAFDVATDAEENVYVGTGGAGAEVIKLDPNGVEIWTHASLNGSEIRSIDVDDTGSVYYGSFGRTVKLDSTGTLVWEYTGQSGTIMSVNVAADGSVYSGSGDTNSEIHKIDSNGNFVWAYTLHTDWITDLTIDDAGNIYSASQDDTVHKIDPNGNQVWSYTGHVGAFVYTVGVDLTGNVYSGSANGELHKVNSNGELVWIYDGHDSNIYGLDVDANGNSYSSTSNGIIHYVDSNGNFIWSYDFANINAWIDGIAIGGEITPSQLVALNSPLDEAIDQSSRPTFEWESEPSAENYTITISDNNLFDPFTIQETITATNFTPSVDLASGNEYIWKVNSTDINGNKKWSSVSGFTVEQANFSVFSGSNDHTVSKLDPNGNEVWSYDYGSGVNAVVTDKDGFTYVAGAANTIHKIDSDGLQVWVYNLHTNTIWDLEIDDDGFLYSASGDATVHKIDPDGNQVWVYNQFDDVVYNIAVDESNIYAAQWHRLHKISSSGNQIYLRENVGFVTALDVNRDGEILINDHSILRKLDQNGGLIWDYDIDPNDLNDSNIEAIAVGIDGNTYFGSQDFTVRKVDPLGNEIWVYDENAGSISDLTIDIEGSIYSAAQIDSTFDGSVHKITPDGNQVWKFEGQTGRVQSLSTSVFDGPLPVVLNTPLNEAIDLSVRPSFDWQPADGAATYQLRVSESPEFTSHSVRESGLTSTSFNLNYDLRENRTYYWRVRGVNANGSVGEWSDVNTFSTEALAFAGGDGSVGNPFQISTTGQLQLVRDNSDQNFILLNDIDARTTRDWSDGQGFNPIGDDVVRFSGRFNGNGYTISNLYINRPDNNDVGIFGNTNHQSVIENVNISNIEIIGGSFSVGGLAGYSDGTIRNVSVSGSIRNTGDNTGGIVGAMGGSGNLSNSNSNVEIDNNSQKVGGLVGEMFGNIEGSFARGNIIAGTRDIGGLVGRSFSNTEINNSYATGNISTNSTSSFIDYFGGFIGRNESTITNSYSTGNVSINGNYIGGFVGDNMGSGNISNSFSTGTVIGNFATGSFAGRNNGSIEQSYALGNVEGGNDTGGFIGENNNNVTNVFAKGNVTGDDQVGGLIGGNRNGSVVSRAYAWGSVTGANSVGGLIGVNPEGNEVNNSYSRGLITGTEDVGGFIGLNAGVVDSSYWDSESSERASGIGRGPTSGVTGLVTADITGQNAVDFMSLFNFENDWKVTDTYPALIWETIGVPRLITPANNALGLSLLPMFEWSTDSEAVSYDLQVGRTSTFPESLALNETGITTNTFTTTTELSPGANYNWRVRIEKEGGEKGDWSEPFNFTTAATVNAANSSVIATTPHAPDGLDASTVTVRLRNDFNVLVGGFTEADFNITVTGAAIATPIAETETAGVYRFELTSDSPTVATIQILADGVQLDDEPLVIFTDDEPELFLFSTSLDSTVRRTDIDGNTIWSSKIDIESGLRTATVTPKEDLYVAGLQRPDIFRFDLNGNLENVITISGGIGIYSLTSDEEGFIYAATLSSNTYKISPTGTVLWSHGGDQNGDYNTAEDVAYDPEGFVYVAHWGGNVKKLDTDGNLIWEFVQGNENGNYDLVSIAVDNTGNVLVGNSNGALRKLDSNGDFVWEYNGFSNYVFEIEFDSDNNVYAGGSDSEVHKLDQEGNPLWVASTNGRWVEGMSVDRNNNLFVGALRDLIKLDIETGEEIWSNDSHDDQIRGLVTGYFIQTGTGIVSLSQPENGANNVSLLPIYNWEPAIGASGYRFQLSSDPEFSNIIVSQDGILNTSISFSNELDPETVYYWRTRGVDGLGIEGDWSETYSFTTLSVDQVYSQLLPELGIQNPNTPLELRFNFGIVLSSIFDAVTITDTENTIYTLSVDEPNPGQFMITTEEKFFAGDQITVNINSSLLQSVSGFDITGNDTTYTFNTSFLGDFSETGSVDSEDLMQIASRWRVSGNDQDITEFDIGPATGTPPRLKSNPDGVINFEDLVIFAFSWGRSLENEGGAAMASAPLSGPAGNRIVDQELASLDEFRETTADREPDMASAFALSYDVDVSFADYTDRLDRYYEELKQRKVSQSQQIVELRTPAKTEQYQRMNEQSTSSDRTMALVLTEDHLLQGYELLVNLPDGVNMENVQVNPAFEQHGGQTFSLKQTSNRGFVLSAANLGQPLELTAGDTLATFTAISSDTEVADMSVAYTLYQTSDQSVKGMYEVLTDLPAEVPDQFQVLQNFPNPFNPATEIRYQLPEQAEVRIRVYDILGRLVFTIAEQQVEAGFYQVTWDASRFASGVYIYIIQARGASGQSYMQTKKMTLIK